MVAAMISYLYFVETRSAAFRKTAARSAKERDSQEVLAFRAESMAVVTLAVVALEKRATGSAWDDGLF